MKLLVTGGAGYIGSVVVATLLASDHEVVVIDDLSTGHADAVPHGATFVQNGVSAAGDVLDDSFDAVLHFAAKALVAESVAHPEVYWSTNVVGSFNLLRAMRDAGVRRLVFSSTAATYGTPSVSPIIEDTPAVPANPYGQSKLAVDHMLAGEARAHGLGAVSLRYFNVAGSSGGLGERHDPETHLIPNVLAVAHGLRESVNVYGTDYDTPDGTAIRDYLHVQDLADAHLRALDAAVPGEHDVVNLGTGTGYSIREVIDACRRVTGHPIPHVDRGRRAGDPPMLVASGERAKARLGWTPRHDLERIVADAWGFVRR
ncbi:MAG TPA: UDP-glucose 4-epimerase GalE [Jiangellaceae bacterium]|nr:UDP-glucose 4-epimerase GalE [Jiangellaceae bacterium]